MTEYSSGTSVTTVSLPESVDALREDLRMPLQELITHELLRQELKKRAILVTDMDFQRAEQEARAPFAMQDALERAKRRQAMENFSGQESEKRELLKDIENIDTFTESLIERGLSLAQWQDMLARQVRKDTFIKQVLEPEIHLTPELIEEAYRAYPELMQLEKRVQFQLFTVSSPDIAEDLKQALQQENSEQIIDISGYIVEDFLMPLSRLPEPWLKVVARAEKNPKFTKEAKHYVEIIKENDELKVFLVQEILPERTLSLGEAYVRLEHLLMEQACAKAFDKWLEQAWKNAHVRVTPQLSLNKSSL